MTCQVDQATIIRGEDKDITVHLIIEESALPLDLVGFTEISAIFLNEDGTQLTLTETGGEISVISEPGGVIKITINDTQSALLKIGKNQTFEIVIDKGVDKTIIQMIEKLNVKKRFFN